MPRRKGRWPGRDISLRTRIIAILLLVGVLPPLLLGYLANTQYDQLLRQEATQITSQSLSQTEGYVSLYLSTIQNIGLFVTESTQIQNILEASHLSTYRRVADADQVTSLFANALDVGSSVPRIVIAGFNGFSYDNGFVPTDLWKSLQVETIAKQIKARHGLSVWRYDANDGMLVNGRYIYYANRSAAVGMILVSVSTSRLATIMQKFRPESGYLVLVDMRDNVLVAPRKIRRSLNPSRWTGELGGHLYGILGNTVYARYPVRDTQWELWSVVPLSGVLRGAQSLKIDLGLIFAAVLLVSLVVAIWLARRLTRPIADLAAMMDRFQNGDSAPVAAPMSGELGRLQHSFQVMSERLNALIDQVLREQLQRREAEWRALQAQIHPHFLYNTLDSINWLARRHGIRPISDMVVALSRMLKFSLTSGPSLVPLRDELTYIRHYIRIQDIRFGGRIRVEIRVPDELQAHLVPKFILQPLVENAVVHGLEPKEGAGTVFIEGREVGDALVLVVEDNGVGMSAEALSAIQKDGANEGYHVGIANVRGRLRALYGEPGKLVIRSTPRGGTVVEIWLDRKRVEAAVLPSRGLGSADVP